MRDRDCLRRFIFERYPIRGHLVHLDAAWRALIEHRDYPMPIRDALGEAVAASLLLAATIKFEGVLSLQMQGDGPVHLLLAQCSGGLGVRGLARYREAGRQPESARIGDLIGTGNLTVTLETDDGAQRYQGIVPLSGQRLAESLQVYFENSEQLPTRLWLHADSLGASGMLLQKLPGAESLTGAAADVRDETEQLGDVDRIEHVGAIAKVAAHLDFAALGEHGTGLCFAEALQHVGQPFA